MCVCRFGLCSNIDAAVMFRENKAEFKKRVRQVRYVLTLCCCVARDLVCPCRSKVLSALGRSAVPVACCDFQVVRKSQEDM